MFQPNRTVIKVLCIIAGVDEISSAEKFEETTSSLPFPTIFTVVTDSFLALSFLKVAKYDALIVRQDLSGSLKPKSVFDLLHNIGMKIPFILMADKNENINFPYTQRLFAVMRYGPSGISGKDLCAAVQDVFEKRHRKETIQLQRTVKDHHGSLPKTNSNHHFFLSSQTKNKQPVPGLLSLRIETNPAPAQVSVEEEMVQMQDVTSSQHSCDSTAFDDLQDLMMDDFLPLLSPRAFHGSSPRIKKEFENKPKSNTVDQSSEPQLINPPQLLISLNHHTSIPMIQSYQQANFIAPKRDLVPTSNGTGQPMMGNNVLEQEFLAASAAAALSHESFQAPLGRSTHRELLPSIERLEYQGFMARGGAGQFSPGDSSLSSTPNAPDSPCTSRSRSQSPISSRGSGSLLLQHHRSSSGFNCPLSDDSSSTQISPVGRKAAEQEFVRFTEGIASFQDSAERQGEWIHSTSRGLKRVKESTQHFKN